MKKILFVGAVIVKNIEMLASAECNCGTGCRWKILEGSGYCVANGDGNSCICGSTTHP
jgi:hypothetical protein